MHDISIKFKLHALLCRMEWRIRKSFFRLLTLVIASHFSLAEINAQVIVYNVEREKATTTLAKYNLTVQNFIKEENETEFDSYILITNGKTLSVLSEADFKVTPTEHSDLKETILGYMVDSLLIGYNHADTSFVIDYEIFMKGEGGPNGCRQTTQFRYEFINELPSIQPQTFTSPENVSPGSVLGQVEAADADNNELTYSIIESSVEGVVTIDSETGVILASDKTLDYESFTQIDLKVSVNDGWGQETTDITLEITNVNEPPEGPTSISNELTENLGQDEVLTTIAVDDPDGDELTYTLLETSPEDALGLSEAGEIFVADSAQFDFESEQNFTLKAETSDGEFAYTTAYSLTITDLNERPVSQPYSFEFFDTDEPGTLIGAILAEDPEGNDIAYTIESGNVDNLFDLDEQSGELFLVNAVGEIEGDKTYNLVVNASDGELNTSTDVTVELIKEIVTSIESEIPDVKVFPNPVKGFLSIQIDENFAQSTSFSLTNTNGKVLLAPQAKQVIASGGMDLSHLSNGVYLLRIKRNSLERTIKIAKQ